MRQIDRKRCVRVIVETNARGFSRLEQSSRARLFDLSERRNIVQNPQSAAVGRDHQIASMHVQIANRSCRQINLQSLPMISAIERYIDAIWWPRPTAADCGFWTM